jgi:heptosyltransferase-2
MNSPGKILVVQTAFPGDVILTIPAIEALHRSFPQARISVVAIPSASGVLLHHPAVDEVIVYDKRGDERGIRGILDLSARLRREKFDVAVIPHRSIRSALIVWLALVPRRIGFSTSAGRLLFTDIVAYVPNIHEIQRNLSLLRPLGIERVPDALPTLYPDENDRDTVDRLLASRSTGKVGGELRAMVGLAPGSVWNTKRWPLEHYSRLGKLLAGSGHTVALIGGREDRELCEAIASAIGDTGVLNAAGRLTLLQSAELIRHCRIIVSNDSAPVHLASAMQTPVIAIFGPTVPSFGFAPQGRDDEVIEHPGLTCRPCSIHGGDVCPIKTFVCMRKISPEAVYARVLARLRKVRT